MEYPLPTLQTTLFLLVFLVTYLVLLLKNANRNTIDLYDMLLLSSIAIVPVLFAFFPKLTIYITKLVGVGFPFLLLFGSLFFIVFVYLYRLVIKINQHHKKNILLIQELSLLKSEIQWMRIQLAKISTEQ
jgi:hypothetical protein